MIKVLHIHCSVRDNTMNDIKWVIWHAVNNGVGEGVKDNVIKNMNVINPLESGLRREIR